MGVFGRGAMSSSAAPTAGMSRAGFVALLVVGIGLALAPVAFQMFHRGPLGAQMMAAFRLFMTDARVNGFQQHIRAIDAGVKEANGPVATKLAGPGPAGHVRFEHRYPAFAQFQKDWQPINADMTNLLDTIQDNAGNYRA